MAENSGSSNTIVTIVVLAALAIGIAYAFGFFGHREEPAKVIEKTTVIEQPKIVNPQN